MADKRRYLKGQLCGSCFKRTATLICQYDVVGEFARVLNRTTGNSVGKLTVADLPETLEANLPAAAGASKAVSKLDRWRSTLLLLLLIQTSSSLSGAPLPKRLVIALDAIAYRDMKALQEGVDSKDSKGRLVHRQGFHEGYYPVSRLVSTFPSTSDVAWTELFGSRPLPGYQRTYYSIAANREIFVNGVTSLMEDEKQVTWRVSNRVHFALSYVQPLKEFQHEVDRMVEDFLNTPCAEENYYALILSTDSGQHMAADIFAMLCTLDERIRDLRTIYRAREGRELEILIMSDHGNNHAGRGRCVKIMKFLRRAGYRATKSIVYPKDVVLPTAGIESWITVHNAPAETERLMELLSHLEGVDVLTGRLLGRDDKFLILNSRGERATIEWDEARNLFRYAAITGDPIQHLPVREALERKGRLDAKGFAPADAWMAESLAHRYPVALERIARGHTRGGLNPATILISLANDYVHAGWLVAAGSSLMKSGGTHGALDDLNSTGILLSSFAPTQDTTSSRVAGLYGGFPGLRDSHTKEQGAEWVSGACQAMIALTRGPLDWANRRLPSDQVFLHIWTLHFGPATLNSPIEVFVKQTQPVCSSKVRPWNPQPCEAEEQRFVLKSPVTFPDSTRYERVYALPPDLILEPQERYSIGAWFKNGGKTVRLFHFTFFTDDRGLPAVY